MHVSDGNMAIKYKAKAKAKVKALGFKVKIIVRANNLSFNPRPEYWTKMLFLKLK